MCRSALFLSSPREGAGIISFRINNPEFFLERAVRTIFRPAAILAVLSILILLPAPLAWSVPEGAPPAGGNAPAGKAERGGVASEAGPGEVKDAVSSAEDEAGLPKGAAVQEVVRKDVRIRFSVTPLLVPTIMEGETAEVGFLLTDASTGSPIGSLYPSAWIDAAEESDMVPGKVVECEEKISAFLRGTIGYQPLIDLNSYFVLGMNNDSTISVFDPVRGISNITQMFTMIYLKHPGEDWALDENGKFLFVTMPKAGAVAIASTETFKVVREIPVGANPARIALQPDRKYFWVGLDARDAGGGVAVIDADGQNMTKRIPTGRGRHEIAFTEDSLFAFVTNGLERTLSVLDVRELKKNKDIALGGTPVNVGYSTLGKAAYVALREGGIAVVDGRTRERVATIPTKPGLSALRFAPGGRWGFAANAKEDEVYLFDPSTNQVEHTLKTGEEPDQIAFTEKFAYFRSRRTTTVSLLELSWLEKGGEAPVINVQVGSKPPSASPYAASADAIVPALAGGHTLIANPADSMIYYYMEGMNAAMAGYRSAGGHIPRATIVVDRSLKEKKKGIYSSIVRLPTSGTMQVALFLDSPRVVQCFEFTARPNPLLEKDKGVPQISFLSTERQTEAGKPFTLRFRLSYRRGKGSIPDLKDLKVRAVHSSGAPVHHFGARHVGDGVYETTVILKQRGWYNLLFSSVSLNLRAGQLQPYPVMAKSASALERKK
jgi:DNA-binding beta-propeller fold protein YncE